MDARRSDGKAAAGEGQRQAGSAMDARRDGRMPVAVGNGNITVFFKKPRRTEREA